MSNRSAWYNQAYRPRAALDERWDMFRSSCIPLRETLHVRLHPSIFKLLLVLGGNVTFLQANCLRRPYHS